MGSLTNLFKSTGIAPKPKETLEDYRQRVDIVREKVPVLRKKLSDNAKIFLEKKGSYAHILEASFEGVNSIVPVVVLGSEKHKKPKLVFKKEKIDGIKFVVPVIKDHPHFQDNQERNGYNLLYSSAAVIRSPVRGLFNGDRTTLNVSTGSCLKVRNKAYKSRASVGAWTGFGVCTAMIYSIPNVIGLLGVPISYGIRKAYLKAHKKHNRETTTFTTQVMHTAGSRLVPLLLTRNEMKEMYQGMFDGTICDGYDMKEHLKQKMKQTPYARYALAHNLIKSE